MPNRLISPHGGELKELLVDEDHARPGTDIQGNGFYGLKEGYVGPAER